MSKLDDALKVYEHIIATNHKSYKSPGPGQLLAQSFHRDNTKHQIKALFKDMIAEVTPQPSAGLVHSHTDIVNYMLRLSQKVDEL